MKTNIFLRGSRWMATGTVRKALAFVLAAGLTFAGSAQNANAFQDQASQDPQGVPGQGRRRRGFRLAREWKLDGYQIVLLYTKSG